MFNGKALLLMQVSIAAVRTAFKKKGLLCVHICVNVHVLLYIYILAQTWPAYLCEFVCLAVWAYIYIHAQIYMQEYFSLYLLITYLHIFPTTAVIWEIWSGDDCLVVIFVEERAGNFFFNLKCLCWAHFKLIFASEVKL